MLKDTSTFISTVIEIYGDKIQVSHGFDGCQKLCYIAVLLNLEKTQFRSHTK